MVLGWFNVENIYSITVLHSDLLTQLQGRHGATFLQETMISWLAEPVKTFEEKHQLTQHVLHLSPRSPQTICTTLCDILQTVCADENHHGFPHGDGYQNPWERCVPSALAPSSPAHPAQKSSSKSPGCKILKTMNILNIPCLPLSIYVLLCKFDVSTYPMELIDAAPFFFFCVYIYIHLFV